MSFFFVAFDFVEYVTIIDWIENMRIYVSDIQESYKDTMIGNLGNSGTADLLLHVVQCWRSCAVDEEKWALPLVLYF